MQLSNCFHKTLWHLWWYTTIPILVKNGWAVKEIPSGQTRAEGQTKWFQYTPTPPPPSVYEPLHFCACIPTVRVLMPEWQACLHLYTMIVCISHLISSHLSLNCEGHWGTSDDFATSFLHSFIFSTALWNLTNSSPVHSLMLSSHLSLCLPCLLPHFTVPCKMVLARPDEWEARPYHCTLRLFKIVKRFVVQLPAGSWHELPRW